MNFDAIIDSFPICSNWQSSYATCNHSAPRFGKWRALQVSKLWNQVPAHRYVNDVNVFRWTHSIATLPAIFSDITRYRVLSKLSLFSHSHIHEYPGERPSGASNGWRVDASLSRVHSSCSQDALPRRRLTRSYTFSNLVVYHRPLGDLYVLQSMCLCDKLLSGSHRQSGAALKVLRHDLQFHRACPNGISCPL